MMNVAPEFFLVFAVLCMAGLGWTLNRPEHRPRLVCTWIWCTCLGLSQSPGVQGLTQFTLNGAVVVFVLLQLYMQFFKEDKGTSDHPYEPI